MLVAAASNLVWNGLDAGTEVVVQVSLEQPFDEHPEKADRKGLCGKITVRDNGPGLSAEVAKTVFEPFVTSKPDGSGLGLAYVARAAQLLGGNVEWRREDRQTLFELRFALEEKNCP
jgi:nitrogen-specific signal transduction histidine kinase